MRLLGVSHARWIKYLVPFLSILALLLLKRQASSVFLPEGSATARQPVISPEQRLIVEILVRFLLLQLLLLLL